MPEPAVLALAASTGAFALAAGALGATALAPGRFPRAAAWGRGAALFAVLLQAGLLLSRFLEQGGIPPVSRYEQVLVIATALGAGALLPAGAGGSAAAGACAALLAAGLVALAGRESAEPLDRVPAAHSAWASLHYALALVSTGLLLVPVSAAAAALLPRFRSERTPGEWHALQLRATRLAFPLFTLALLAGCVWHRDIWSSVWGWDVVETGTLVPWLLFAAWLHLRPAGDVSVALGPWLLLAAGAALLAGRFLLHLLPDAISSLDTYA